MSPTSRTLAALRQDGWTVQTVEHWNHYTKRRHDLFGCIDIVAIREGRTLGVQCTSGSNTSSRLHKIAAEPRMKLWLQAGNELEVWGWRQLVARKKDGSKAARKKWEPKIEKVALGHPIWTALTSDGSDASPTSGQ